MKYLKIKAILIIIMLQFSCNNDDDSPMICPEGYEGEICTTAFNAKFAGSFSLVETCDTGPANYTMTIVADANNPLNMIIWGLWEEPTSTVNAIVNTSNSKEFTVIRQNFSNGGWDISATGSINENGVVSILYTTYNQADNSVIDNCTSTMTPN